MPHKTEIFKEFIEKIKDKQRIQILSHTDSDGLCSAVIIYKVLQRLGLNPLDIIYPEKGENIFCSSGAIPPLQEKLKQINPDALFVLDLGINADIIPQNTPALFIDHHYIYPCAGNALYISSYGDKNPRPASLLTYDLCHGVCDVKDLGHLAVIGTIGNLGADNPFNITSSINEDYSMAEIKEISVLINSAKRASVYDIAAALKMIMQLSSPRQIINKELPEVELLQRYRDEVNYECKKARHIAPVFKWKVALISFSNPCDIGGLLASMWANQLQNYLVITVNFGYIPQKAEFIIKTNTKIDVIKFMESVKPKNILYKIALGHKSGAGGIVDLNLWKQMAENMGYKE